LKIQRLMVYLIFLSIVLVGCLPASTSQTATARNRIVYGLTLEPSGFDPHINESAELGIVLRQVYDTLVYRDPTTYEIVPGLAAAWTISEDGLTYTFNLREGVTFHDGTPFNAQAVAANLDRISNPATASQRALFLLGPYVGYNVVDDLTIEIRLSQPYSPLLDGLSQVYLGIASPTALAAVSNNRYQYHQVGTGPFVFVEYTPSDHLVIRRNPDYAWGPGFYNALTDSSVDEIEYRFYPDPPTRAIALENGEVQVMGELLPIDARGLTGNSEVQLVPVAVPGEPLQFFMNTQRFPTDSLDVRRALIYGTNRAAIADTVYQGFAPVAWGPISAATIFYASDIQGVYAHDTSQAQAALENAGFVDADQNGYLDVPEGDLEIKILVPTWNFLPDVAQLIEDQWRIIGVKAVLQPVPSRGSLIEAVNAGDYNLVAWNTFGVDPSILNTYFLTGANRNWTGFSSQDLDNILLQASSTIDIPTRRMLYSQAQHIIMDNALILPIADPVNLNGASASVIGLAYDPYGWFPIMNNVTLAGD
jgi:peptide/nickel transport system substrate-binding protein